jgi:hypothetical protein
MYTQTYTHIHKTGTTKKSDTYMHTYIHTHTYNRYNEEVRYFNNSEEQDTVMYRNAVHVYIYMYMYIYTYIHTYIKQI